MGLGTTIAGSVIVGATMGSPTSSTIVPGGSSNLVAKLSELETEIWRIDAASTSDFIVMNDATI